MLTIGLVNNMPDSALRSTDRQFNDLLTAAARNLTIRIFSQRDGRSETAQQYLAEYHEPLDDLWDSDIDGLIVTGMEPKSRDLVSEPCWPVLTQLADWAATRKIPTIWSCLAAHAMVRYLDGIDRYLLPEKMSGVFTFVRRDDHPFLRRHEPQWFTPHSRHNEIREQDLLDCGYQILSHSPVAGVDIFAKCGSLFLFLQGHPEYDHGALFREYRRDAGRFLIGERADYPELPRGYLRDDLIGPFLRFREKAVAHRAQISDFPTMKWDSPASWEQSAISLYSSWLGFLTIRRDLGFARQVFSTLVDRLMPPNAMEWLP